MMQSRLRTTVLTIFCAYIAFVVAGLALYGMVDDSPFIPAMNSHLDLALAWFALAAGSALALAGAVIGGMPIGYALVVQALKARRRDIVLLLAVPLLALLALVVYVVMVAVLTDRMFGDGGIGRLTVPAQLGAPVLVGFGLLFIIAAIASTGAVCAAVLRSEADEAVFRAKGITISVRPYEFALLPGALTTLAMLLMLAATVAWGVIARADVPQAFDEQTGLFMPVQASVTWALVVLVMAMSTIVAAVALARGFRLSGRNTSLA
jgi:hypothetical protein